MTPSLPSSSREWPWLALALGATLPLAIACLCERHLAMDGVNTFIMVVDSRAPILETPARLVADTLIQLPLFAAVLAGVSSLPVLVAFFGLGAMLPFWFGTIAAWYALPSGRKYFMALPIWSLLVLSFPVDGHLTHQSHVMTPMLWPALFLVAREEPWRRLEAVLALTCLATLALSYETVFCPALLLAALAAWRARRLAADPAQRRLALAVAALAALGVGIGLAATLLPATESNRANFLASLREPWLFGQVPVGTAALVIFLGGWAAGRRIVLLVLGGLLLGAVGWWVQTSSLPIRGGAYQARTLALTLMPLMFVAGAALVVRRRPLPSNGFAICALAVAVLSAPFFGHLSRWLDYRAEVTRLTRTGRGFIEVKGTKLEWNWERNSWNLPELSVVWGGSPVRAVVVNPPGQWPWEAFDPRRMLPLRKYLSIDPALQKEMATAAKDP